ncbi:hypothetical protein GCM10009689_26510 [Brevibacterium antiquum]
MRWSSQTSRHKRDKAEAVANPKLLSRRNEDGIACTYDEGLLGDLDVVLPLKDVEDLHLCHCVRQAWRLRGEDGPPSPPIAVPLWHCWGTN